MKNHLPRRPASRWRLGRALCGAKIGTGTPVAKAAGDAYDAIAGMLDPAEDDDTAATLKRLVEVALAKSAATGRPVRVFTSEFGDEGDDE